MNFIGFFFDPFRHGYSKEKLSNNSDLECPFHLLLSDAEKNYKNFSPGNEFSYAVISDLSK